MKWPLPQLVESCSRRQTGWAVLFLATLSFSLYVSSLGNEFVWDGEEVFLQDPSIRDLHYLPGYFSEGFFAHIPSQGNTLAYLDYYRPAIKALHLLEFQLFGEDPRVTMPSMC